MKNNNELKYDRRSVLKYAGAGAVVAGIGTPTVAAQGKNNAVTLTTTEGWITADVTPKMRTVISINLDEGVYDRWPDNPTSYVMEANIGLPNEDDEPTDAFRIGWAGADTVQRDGTAGGYIRRNVGTDATPDRFDTLEEDVQGLFQATESADQQSYELVVNWRTPLPEAPNRIDAIQVNEVFGLDGGEGVQNEGIEVSTESSGVLSLTGN